MPTLWRWFDDTRLDLRVAGRVLRRNPGFTVAAVVTLAIGIGANTAVFSIADSVLFRGFPHVDPDGRIVYIQTRQAGAGSGVSYPDFEDWRAQTPVFDGMAVVANGGLRLPVRDGIVAPETCDATQLSVNAFQVLRQKPRLGRDFSRADENADAAPVAILSDAFWARRYGRDPAIIGRTLLIDNVSTVIIGVMAPDMYFPHRRVDLWLPLVPARGMMVGLLSNREILRQRQRRVLWFAFARLADGATVRSVQAAMATVGARLEEAYTPTNKGVRPEVLTFGEFFIGPAAALKYSTMWGAVGFVLLIACANVATLLLGRGIERSRETSIRIALGAGRWRIVRQLMIESLMLASVGSAFGWWTAALSVRAYESIANAPSTYNRWDYVLDHRVLLYLIGTSVATALVFGFLPAVWLARIEVAPQLKNGGAGGAGGSHAGPMTTFLIVGELALAVVLLVGAGVLIRSFVKIHTADIGVRTANILTASVTFPPARYPHPREAAFFDQLAARLRALPGVDSVALASRLPTSFTPRFAYETIDTTFVDPSRRPTAFSMAIGPEYFDVLGAKVLAGRPFTGADDVAPVSTAIVNQRFARAVWPGRDALGKRLKLFRGSGGGEWFTVVGVVSDIVQGDVTGQRFDPVVYIPFRQVPADAGIVIARTHVPAETLIGPFRREIYSLDSDLVVGSGLGSIAGPQTLATTLAINAWDSGVSSLLFFVFGGVALLLASIGLYAAVAQAVGRRTREIGVRTALGARQRDVVALVIRQGMLAVWPGLGIGLIASSALNRLLKNQLVAVTPSDPLTLAAASAILILAATLGCWIPARRAARVDPVVALRQD